MEKIIILILMIEALKLIEKCFEEKEKKFQIYFGKLMNIKIIIIVFYSLYNLFE
jgi:hypothetical protein